MSKQGLLIAFILVSGLCATTVPAFRGDQADAGLDALIDAIRANRKAMVAVNLELTDSEAAGFWSVYERYQKEINAVGDRFVEVVRDYTASFNNLADDKAMKLVEDYLTVEADRVKVKRTYVAEFAKVLPGRKLARLYQIENKMDAVIRYDLAASIPVIPEHSGSTAK